MRPDRPGAAQPIHAGILTHQRRARRQISPRAPEASAARGSAEAEGFLSNRILRTQPVGRAWRLRFIRPRSVVAEIHQWPTSTAWSMAEHAESKPVKSGNEPAQMR